MMLNRRVLKVYVLWNLKDLTLVRMIADWDIHLRVFRNVLRDHLQSHEEVGN